MPLSPIDKLLVSYVQDSLWTPTDPSDFAWWSLALKRAMAVEHDVVSTRGHHTPLVPLAAGLVSCSGGVYTTVNAVNSVGNPTKIATGRIRVTVSLTFASAADWMLFAWPSYSSLAGNLFCVELDDTAASAPRTATTSEILFVNSAGTATDPTGLFVWVAHGNY